MAVSITFSNDISAPLERFQFSTNIAHSVQVNESFVNVLRPYASTSFITEDTQFYGTGGSSVSIKWKEASTGTIFGFRVDYPFSLAGIHLENYEWGYMVSPAPDNSLGDWVKISAANLNNTYLTQPVIVRRINKQFLYSIQPRFTATLMAFSVSIGVDKNS